jgi:hypothetical protein
VEEYKEYPNRNDDTPPRERVIYLHPDKQNQLYPELSELIGWKTIQRRNIGFVYAYHNGAFIVATVDDDNIPYNTWGDNLLVGRYNVEVDCYDNTLCDVFDSFSVFKEDNLKSLAHRGYPLEYLQLKNSIQYKGKRVIEKVLIQADFWDGDPDISAMDRLTKRPMVKFPENVFPFTSNQVSPFNSQNTFIHREALPFYCVLPFVGRYDDIWASYITQRYFPGSIVFSKASVFQDRNPQDFIKNLENEVMGYRNTLPLLAELKDKQVDDIGILPEKTREFWAIYRDTMDDPKLLKVK